LLTKFLLARGLPRPEFPLGSLFRKSLLAALFCALCL